jgi:molecular chaperone GrpE (heat shock protein)
MKWIWKRLEPAAPLPSEARSNPPTPGDPTDSGAELHEPGSSLASELPFSHLAIPIGSTPLNGPSQSVPECETNLAECVGRSAEPLTTAELPHETSGPPTSSMNESDERRARAGEAMTVVSQRVSEIATRQGELARMFESRVHANDVQAKALERLHDELQSYKLQFMRQEMLPLLKDIIYCYDFAAGELERLKTNEEAGRPESLAKALEHMRQMVQDVLFKYDVELYRGETDEFDRKVQQCVQTVPTMNQADDKKVAAVGHVGFKSASEDTVIRKEQVTVYKYSPAP